jgi:hypothetical protein
MSERKLGAKQKHMSSLIKKANVYVKVMMTDVAKRGTAQLRLNVSCNRFYTSLVREYFHNELISSDKV